MPGILTRPAPAAGRSLATVTRASGVEIVVRPATAQDDDALAALDEQTWTPDVSPAPAPPPGTPFFRATDPADVLVAELDGAVVGYVTLAHPTPLPSSAHVVIINGLAVAPHAQGRGAGRELTQAAIAEARRRGARKISLRVLGPNTVARRLYEGCGFTVEGVLRGEFLLEGVEVDDVFMARRLD
jgi:ribosomal protein S18 acetylase RimI-like enzyme